MRSRSFFRTAIREVEMVESIVTVSIDSLITSFAIVQPAHIGMINYAR